MYSFTHCGANSYPHLSLLFFIICRYRYVTWSPNVPICIQWCPPALLYNDFIIRQRYHSMAGQHRLIALPSVAITFYYKYDRVFFKFYHFSLSSPHLTCRWYDKKTHKSALLTFIYIHLDEQSFWQPLNTNSYAKFPSVPSESPSLPSTSEESPFSATTKRLNNKMATNQGTRGRGKHYLADWIESLVRY